jgi:septum site-determining protein MinC
LYQLKDQKPGAEIKGSAFTLTVIRLLSSELAYVERDLRDKISTGPRFFANAPVVLDLERVRDSRSDLDFSALVMLLKELALVPVGVRHATPAQQEAAVDAGLAIVKGGGIRELPAVSEQGVASNDKSGGPQIPEPPPPPPPPRSAESSAASVRARTLYRPVRSGQQIYAKDGDLVVLGAVNAGAEVVSDGDVHVYGPLRGRALAGAQGDRQARIFCLSMAAELVAIAGRYQVLDETVPQEVRGRAVQVYLEGEKLRFELLA